MPSTKDIDLKNDPHKILLVGENGMGKSIAAASFFKAGPIRMWDFDGRLKPVKSYYPNADINYDTFTAENFRQFITEINSLVNSCPYKTLVLDSVTTASVLCVTFQLGVKGLAKTTSGIPKTSWDEINGETVLFTQMLEAMKDVHKRHKVNIIWTAHPVPKIEISDEGTKRLTSLAAYGNKIPALIPGYFDEIHNFERVKSGMTDFKYMVNTTPKNNLPGKTAFPNQLPASFDITKKNYYEILMGYLNA